jgi:acetolactate synthase I/II/III large subunit
MSVADERPSYRGGEIIIDYLIRERVSHLFGVCGHGILGLLDAAYDRRDEINTITTHDERVAGLMADAYYRVARRPAATYTSCGPGSANLVMAVASAFQDSSAFLAITGNVPTSQFNRGPFQETGRYFQGDFASVMRPYVKRSYQAFRPEMLPLTMRQAFALMLSGRPGPVHVDVPLNVFAEQTSEPPPPTQDWVRDGATRGAGDPRAIAAAAALLRGAHRPLIVAGNGALLARCQPELAELSALLGIPVATSPLGKGSVNERAALSLGPTGRNGSFPANAAAREADVLLALGTRFDDRATSSWIPGMTYSIPPTRLIHVDIDPQELGRNYQPTVAVLGDAAAVLRQLAAELAASAPAIRKHTAPWAAQVTRWKEEWERFLTPLRESDAAPIQPARLVAELERALPGNAIVLADVGLHHNWLLQQLRVGGAVQLLQAWGFASMGFGVAGALGAKFAAPHRPVVAVCGDGGFLMHANAVATAVQYDLPVVWIIWNNRGYGAIYNQQAGFFGADRELATRFRNMSDGSAYTADLAAMARAMGASGQSVDKPADLASEIAAALASGRPTVLDVPVDDSTPAPSTGSWDLPPLLAPPPSFTGSPS